MITAPLKRILDWLHAGYPDGIPPTDYFALLALLSSQLSRGEVRQIVESLIAEADDSVTRTDIGVAVNKVTDDVPSEEDLERVAARLAAVGWPLVDGVHVRDGGADDSAGTPAP